MKSLDRLNTNIIKEGDHYDGLALPCWSWTGAIDDKNRPRIKVDGYCLLAKRAIYQLNGFSLEQDQFVISLCKNKGCLRPEHLVIGNEKDAFKLRPKGRMGHGDMYAMRLWYKNGEIELIHIEECYGITRPVAEAVLAEGKLITRSQPPYSHCNKSAKS